jgi:hypothetical protein
MKQATLPFLLTVLLLRLCDVRADETNSIVATNPATNPATNVAAAETHSSATNSADTNSVVIVTNEPPSDPGFQNTRTNVRLDYSSFRLIAERNIFNPNRSARSDRSTRRDREPRRIRVEAFGLVGTMSYEKGNFAFFDGSSSEYRKVVQPSESIGDYKVTEIASNSVTLESTNGRSVQLTIGAQMRKQDDEEWKLNERGASFESAEMTGTPTSTNSSAPETTGTNTTTGTNAATTTSGAGEDEILKRLLQKREEEFKNEKK